MPAGESASTTNKVTIRMVKREPASRRLSWRVSEYRLTPTKPSKAIVPAPLIHNSHEYMALSSDDSCVALLIN